MKIVIVEDDANKLGQIAEFIAEEFPHVVVERCRSFHSALDAICDCVPDIVLLDMSIPSYDPNHEKGDGRFRRMGGAELMCDLNREGVRAKVAIVTQFDRFGEEAEAPKRADLHSELAELYPHMYMGMVYYHPAQTHWRVAIADMIGSFAVGDRRDD